MKGRNGMIDDRSLSGRKVVAGPTSATKQEAKDADGEMDMRWAANC